MYCPKDLKPCIDDLCYGGGCLVLDGAALYYRCVCGALVSEDDHDECGCDDGDDYFAEHTDG